MNANQPYGDIVSPARAWANALFTWLQNKPSSRRWPPFIGFLWVLSTKTDADGVNTKPPGSRTLAKACGTTPNMITRFYAAAEAAGVIRVERSATGRYITGYSLAFPPQGPDWRYALLILADGHIESVATDSDTEASPQLRTPEGRYASTEDTAHTESVATDSPEPSESVATTLAPRGPETERVRSYGVSESVATASESVATKHSVPTSRTADDHVDHEDHGRDQVVLRPQVDTRTGAGFRWDRHRRRCHECFSDALCDEGQELKEKALAEAEGQPLTLWPRAASAYGAPA